MNVSPSKIEYRLFIRLFLIAALMLLFSLVNAAPGISIDNPDSALSITLSQFPGTFISLNQAINLALKNSTSVLEASAVLKSAKGILRREKGAFDPELFAEAQKSSVHEPAASLIPGVGSFSFVQADVLLTGSAGLRFKLPTGTKLEASVNSTKLETNSQFALLNPQYSSFGKLEFTQPLLAGFGPAAWAGVSSARRSYDAAQAGYQASLLLMAALVEQTYWDLYAAERDLAVQMLIRDQAAAFLQETQLRAASGLVGPNQVANATVFLAEQEQTVLDQEEDLDKISNQLTTLLGQRPTGLLRYRPSDIPPSELPIENIDSLLERAYSNNQTLKAFELNWAAAKAQAKGGTWNALPKLDLFGSLGANGLSGTDTLVGPFNGNANRSWTQVFERDYPTWNVGVRLTFPLGLRSGFGEQERLQGEADRAYQQYLAVKRALEEQVRAAYQELVHAKQRLESAQKGVEASAEQVRIGMLEYQAGRTTAFELVRLRADMALAQQRYSQALVRAAKAAAEIKKLTSASFDQN